MAAWAQKLTSSPDGMKNVHTLPGEITTDSQSQPWASLDWTVEQSGLVVWKIVTGFPPGPGPGPAPAAAAAADDDDAKTRAVIRCSAPVMIIDGQKLF
jgi:hypothetical protein